MDHDQYLEIGAEAKQDEPLFISGMVGVVDKPRSLVRKYGHSLFERDSVLT